AEHSQRLPGTSKSRWSLTAADILRPALREILRRRDSLDSKSTASRVITPSNGSVNQAAQDVAGVVDGCEPPDPEGRAELGHRVHRGRPAASVHQTLVPGRRTEHSALMTSSFATARSARPADPPRTKDSEAPRREQDVVPVPRS